MSQTLPIAQVRQPVIAALRARGRVVLAAPTGSGKTTQLPQYLHEDLQPPGRIIVLQPRRLAATMMARRVAQEMQSPLGKLVGYQTRHDTNIADTNVIRFMTEGLLLRLMQSNPTLQGVSVVVLDEFHERNIASDAALAMLKRLQATARPDLKLVVMSATLDVQRIAAYLDCPVVETDSRTYDVAVHYTSRQAAPGRPAARTEPVWDQAARVLQAVLSHEDEGDVLVFMPGVHEIRRTIDACTRAASGLVSQGRLQVLPLYSQLPPAQQQLAVEPSPAGVRKVIVSTNVAETSLTIPGVRHVIDSGLARVNRYDSRRGVNTLWLEPISQASATQRAGRAGRTAPGTCWRLWPEFEHKGRAARNTPEIRRLDIAQTMLWLLSLGIRNVRDFDWLEPPASEAVEQAAALLRELDAVADDAEVAAPHVSNETQSDETSSDETSSSSATSFSAAASSATAGAALSLTPTGQTMAKLSIHPRWARVLVEASRQRCLGRAALWAAIVSERDLLTREHRPRPHELPTPCVSDLAWLEALHRQVCDARFHPARAQALGVNPAAAREVQQAHQQLLDQSQQAGLATRAGAAASSSSASSSSSSSSSFASSEQEQVQSVIGCLLTGFGDHVALRREQGRQCSMAGGLRRACELSPQSVVDPPRLFLSLDVRETGAGTSVKTLLGLNSVVEPWQLESRFPGRVVEERVVTWVRQKQAVEEVQQKRFDDLIFEQTFRPTPDPSQAAAMLAQLVQQGELKLEKWDESVTQWIARVRSVAVWFPEQKLIQYDQDELAVLYQEICDGCTRYSQVRDKPCLDVVKSAMDWPQQQFVEQMAPARVTLPGGWRMPLTYSDDGSPPHGRGKIQDFYDLHDTPAVAAGRVKVLLEILGPNYRAVQLTQDLAGFWQTLYPQLKKELKRRYPRHDWR